MAEQLERELKRFQELHQELLSTSPEKYVLIHEDQLVGSYDTESDAINEGYRRFGNVPFLVKQVLATERPLNFLSGLVEI
ncbi:hypothetical protein [Dermatobacter hominis]|uniref:hypothetical protein n=1 Tax=Dermatobacter hominis TaxID=2884263 RepID=UPI001D115F58|nr:hypothetical protein [Dermatobacter hominis]UDY35525.1 hypothetical protein LH044_19615 [Dermatobacter hominis]